MMYGTAENRVLERIAGWRCAKKIGKSGICTYLLDFVGVFCEKTR